jgi:hypothetical protein
MEEIKELVAAALEQKRVLSRLKVLGCAVSDVTWEGS